MRPQCSFNAVLGPGRRQLFSGAATGRGLQLAAMSQHKERYVPADQDDGKVRKYWKWVAGCPCKDSCSSRFVDAEKLVYSFDLHKGEGIVREYMVNHLYSSTKHKGITTWAQATAATEKYEREMKASGHPCMVRVEESAEERKEYRDVQDEYMRSLRDKGLSGRDDDEAKQRPAASARSSSSVAKTGTTGKAAGPKLASLPERRPADPERYKREAAVSPERRVRARKASPEGREPEALVPAAKEPSKFTDEGAGR